LKLTIEKLIETDKGLDTFLYRSSHDLRGPITRLLGLASVARAQNHQGELDTYFDSMENAASRMLRLLGRLTDTGALFRAKPRSEVIRFDEFVQPIRAQLSILNPNNVVRIEMENQLGECFTGDPVLLSHIVEKLMENSILFCGESQPFARCTLRHDDQSLIIQVIDNGIGISPDVRDQIFDMFYRGTERSMGNGLGLFMVKKALEILQGTIDIESEQNNLTTITVRIPQIQPELFPG
jgi:signal transduction histidine kinase